VTLRTQLIGVVELDRRAGAGPEQAGILRRVAGQARGIGLTRMHGLDVLVHFRRVIAGPLADQALSSVTGHAGLGGQGRRRRAEPQIPGASADLAMPVVRVAA